MTFRLFILFMPFEKRKIYISLSLFLDRYLYANKQNRIGIWLIKEIGRDLRETTESISTSASSR